MIHSHKCHMPLVRTISGGCGYHHIRSLDKTDLSHLRLAGRPRFVCFSTFEIRVRIPPRPGISTIFRAFMILTSVLACTGPASAHFTQCYRA
ncbi:hypothetical protein CPC08DRAFT_516460 [Agrocybe pediades]|nr:hypothetical protein CPC08DRAFT_516460 [Agrocybe pediades]